MYINILMQFIAHCKPFLQSQMLAMFLMININMIRNTKCEVQTVTLAVTPTKIQNELISTFFVDNYKSKTTKENQHFLHKIVKRSPDNQLLCLPTNKLSSVPTDLFTVSTAVSFRFNLYNIVFNNRLYIVF